MDWWGDEWNQRPMTTQSSGFALSNGASYSSSQAAGKRLVAVYAPQVLPISQPWIADHVASLRQFDGVLLGRSTVSGAAVEHLAHYCIDRLDGRFGARLFLVSGRNRKLDYLLGRLRPSLIHAHFGPGGTEIVATAKRENIPLVVSFHGYDVRWIMQRARATAYERLYAHRLAAVAEYATLLLAPSEALRRQMIRAGLPSDRIRTHYLGVDTAIFAPAGSAAAPQILFVGRMVRQKGVYTLLEAFERVHQRMRSATLVYLGGGEELEKLKAIASERRLPVTFLGAQPQYEVRACLAQSRVLCLPSITGADFHPEALGLSAVEAQAMGVPVVASKVGGLPEAVDDRRSGLLVEEGDAAALSEAILSVLSDPPTHASFSRRARELALERFSLEKNSTKLESIYDEVLASCGESLGELRRSPGARRRSLDATGFPTE
jgi:glycosyltransferase involved in cell wall biosynthesis